MRMKRLRFVGFPDAWSVLRYGTPWVAGAVMLHGAGALAQQGIYTCTDGLGRKITSDRPIAECVDREQKELNRSGTVKRVIGPSLTAHERAALEEAEKAAADVRARQAEEKRRDKALLMRYPSRPVHDKERSSALAQIDEVIKASNKRLAELGAQRKSIDDELEFYKADPRKAPEALKRRIEENDASAAVQRRFQTDQDAEKKRVNARFDEELLNLNQLWALSAVPVVKPKR